MDCFCGNCHKLCIFLFSKAGKFKTSMAQLSTYNKPLTNLASSSCILEDWPSVAFVQVKHNEVCTAMTLGQYSPVLPSHSVSNRLV